MLPGKSDSKRQICVTFDKLPCLTSNPNSSEDSPSKQELDINAYVSLLRRNGSIPDRVHLRGPADARFWPSFACYLYYFIFLHPSDIIQGRCELSYWEAQQEMKKQERQNRMKKKWLDWTAQRNLVSYFSERIYQKLLLFEMPVFIQVDQSLMPADKFFAYVKWIGSNTGQNSKRRRIIIPQKVFWMILLWNFLGSLQERILHTWDALILFNMLVLISKK